MSHFLQEITVRGRALLAFSPLSLCWSHGWSWGPSCQAAAASHGWSWNNTTRSGQGRTSFITWTDTHWEYLSITQSLCNSCLLSECCLNICVKLITNYPADCQQFLMIGLLSSREPSLYCRTHTSLTHSRQMVVKTAALTAVRAVFTTSNRDSAQSSPLSQ